MDAVIDKEAFGASKEEFLVIFESLASNPSHRHLATKFLHKRFPDVVQFLNGTRSVNVLIGLLTDYLHTEEEIVEVMNPAFWIFHECGATMAILKNRCYGEP